MVTRWSCMQEDVPEGVSAHRTYNTRLEDKLAAAIAQCKQLESDSAALP